MTLCIIRELEITHSVRLIETWNQRFSAFYTVLAIGAPKCHNNHLSFFEEEISLKNWEKNASMMIKLKCRYFENVFLCSTMYIWYVVQIISTQPSLIFHIKTKFLCCDCMIEIEASGRVAVWPADRMTGYLVCIMLTLRITRIPIEAYNRPISSLKLIYVTSSQLCIIYV